MLKFKIAVLRVETWRRDMGDRREGKKTIATLCIYMFAQQATNPWVWNIPNTEHGTTKKVWQARQVAITAERGAWHQFSIQHGE